MDRLLRGLAYHTISATKSVLSGTLHILGVTAISEHPLVIRLLKGIFLVRPPQPHYELIWDTDLVLSYLKNLSSSKYSLKFLSLKIVTPLTLLCGQRVNTVHQFHISHMQTTPSLIIFNIPGLLKHSRHKEGIIRYLFMLSLRMLTYAQLPLLISISLHEQHWRTMSYMLHFSYVIENHMDPKQKIPSLGGYVPF